MLPQALPQLLGVVVVAAAGRGEGGRRVQQASRWGARPGGVGLLRRCCWLLGSPWHRTDCAGGRQGEQEGEAEAGHRVEGSEALLVFRDKRSGGMSAISGVGCRHGAVEGVRSWVLGWADCQVPR